MNNIKIGDKLQIHCYKHNKKIYRSWSDSIVLDINNDFIVLANEKTTVTEADGRTWKTKEPAILYFFKGNWYNVISQFKNKGIFYYCNIATPYIVEDNTIKYIDYDLDLRIFPDETYKILDKDEYEYHKRKMAYSKDIDIIVNNELQKLIDLYKNKGGPFSNFITQYYYSMYKKMKMGVKK
jgi:uncharacterized protein